MCLPLCPADSMPTRDSQEHCVKEHPWLRCRVMTSRENKASKKSKHGDGEEAAPWRPHMIAPASRCWLFDGFKS